MHFPDYIFFILLIILFLKNQDTFICNHGEIGLHHNHGISSQKSPRDKLVHIHILYAVLLHHLSPNLMACGTNENLDLFLDNRGGQYGYLDGNNSNEITHNVVCLLYHSVSVLY